MSLLGGREEPESVPTKAQQKAADTKVSRLKANLQSLLAQPLVAKGVSPRYITSGAVSIADDMLAGNCTSTSALGSAPRCTHFIGVVHDMMVGLKKVEAGSDLVASANANQKRRRRPSSRRTENLRSGERSPVNPPCSFCKLIVFLAAPACVRLGNTRHVMDLTSGFVVRTLDLLLSSKPCYLLLVGWRQCL